MKKFLGGCLVVLLLAAVAAAAAGYFLYRAARPLVDDARSYIASFSALDDLDRGLRNTSSYTPPSSGELTAGQVERFARVQEHVRTALGRRIDEIDQKYQRLRSERRDSDPPSITEAMGALRDLMGVIVEARRYQVEALNEEGFSQDEYGWVRGQVLQAAGIEVTSLIDLRKLEEAIKQGTGATGSIADRLPRPSVAEKNRALVKPLMPRMDRWLPLIFFGL